MDSQSAFEQMTESELQDIVVYGYNQKTLESNHRAALDELKRRKLIPLNSQSGPDK